MAIDFRRQTRRDLPEPDRPPEIITTYELPAAMRPAKKNWLAKLRTARCDPAYGWVPLITFFIMFGSVLWEPAQHAETSALETVIVTILFYGVVALYGFGAHAAFSGRRLGLFIALPATVLMLVDAALCPVSGHHAWGLWVIGSFVTVMAGAALHVGALVRSARTPTRRTPLGDDANLF